MEKVMNIEKVVEIDKVIEMETRTSNRLWSRDFTLLMGGKIVSIFGNTILSFVLPLYILYISGSPALFGMILGLTSVPMLIMAPVGGLIADRFRKQRIMFWLDITTTVLIVAYMAASGFLVSVLPIVIIKLMSLNAIQGLYMPAVEASLPLLVPKEKLMSANAFVSFSNTFSGMAGAAIAGILFARFGLMPVLVVSAICFAITSGVDLLIRIPYKKQESKGSIIETTKSDILQSAKFIFREKPIIAKCAWVSFMISGTLASMIMIGVPVLVTQHLGMGMDYVGISQSIMLAGGVIGGILSGTIGNKLKISKTYLLLIASGFAIVPIGLVFAFNTPTFMAYIIITAACAMVLISNMIVSIRIATIIQGETPVELLGKVMSLIVVLPLLAIAFGNLAYGMFFEWFAPWVVVYATAFISIIIGMYARKQFSEK